MPDDTVSNLESALTPAKEIYRGTEGDDSLSNYKRRTLGMRPVTPSKREKVRNAELHRLIKVMNSLDEDGSGTIDYDEFYNFFLQCGYVLEYKTVQGIAGKMLEAAGEHGLKKLRADKSPGEDELGGRRRVSRRKSKEDNARRNSQMREEGQVPWAPAPAAAALSPTRQHPGKREGKAAALADKPDVRPEIHGHHGPPAPASPRGGSSSSPTKFGRIPKPQDPDSPRPPLPPTPQQLEAQRQQEQEDRVLRQLHTAQKEERGEPLSPLLARAKKEDQLTVDLDRIGMEAPNLNFL